MPHRRDNAARVLPRVAWVLYIAAVLWAAVYDTIYAMIDREDDLKIGVRSSAAKIFPVASVTSLMFALPFGTTTLGRWCR